MKVILLLFSLCFFLAATGQTRQLCFTYDDLPVVAYGINDSAFQQQLTDRLVAALEKSRIPAIGFVNERKMYHLGQVNPVQLALLRTWTDHGLDLGNHTFSHPDYNKVTYREFTKDVLKGETLTRKLLQEKGSPLKYFRHPFLHVGETKAKADSLETFLRDHHYTVAPVTIDNEDYLFALAYHRANAKKDTVLMKQIGTDFLSYLEAKVKYYERQSVALFGREIPQILLLHASLLNSVYAEHLAQMFRKNNYAFVSLEKALEDSAYRTEITVYGKWGISWIDKWALSKGKKGDFFRGDPETPGYIKQMTE